MQMQVNIDPAELPGIIQDGLIHRGVLKPDAKVEVRIKVDPGYPSRGYSAGKAAAVSNVLVIIE